MKIILSSVVLSGVLLANQNITLQWLQDKPKSIAKDFYIYRYLNQDINSSQALKALQQIKYLNNSMFHRFAKKYNEKIYKYQSKCLKMSYYKLPYETPFCIETGLSVYDATRLSSNLLEKTRKKIKNKYPILEKKLKIIDSSIPFDNLILSDNKIFFGVFNQCGGKYRVKYFNRSFPSELLSRLKTNKQFYQMIKLIVTNPKMTNAQKSLFGFYNKNLDFRTTFMLAINSIKYNKIDQALLYLSEAYKKAYFQMQKDNIVFWQYLLTKDKRYLELLLKSWDINIYTIYAYQTVSKKFDNIIYDIKVDKEKNKLYDPLIPFKWLSVLKDTKKMSLKKIEKYNKLFDAKDTLGHLAFVKERFYKYKKSYFITPYKESIKNLPIKRQILLYALARQESRFIPTSISSSYALGIMQIMPFLSKALSKQLKEPYNIDNQFIPEISLKYASKHLDFLEKRLPNPLFIAYAYNGGIGFTKRILKNGLFKEKGKYEPFLSMELLPYDETKKYGKKVLANYIIYYNYLIKAKKLRIIDFFNSIIKSNHK